MAVFCPTARSTFRWGHHVGGLHLVTGAPEAENFLQLVGEEKARKSSRVRRPPGCLAGSEAEGPRGREGRCSRQQSGGPSPAASKDTGPSVLQPRGLTRPEARMSGEQLPRKGQPGCGLGVHSAQPWARRAAEPRGMLA